MRYKYYNVDNLIYVSEKLGNWAGLYAYLILLSIFVNMGDFMLYYFCSFDLHFKLLIAFDLKRGAL